MRKTHFIQNKPHWHIHRVLRGRTFSENLPKIPRCGPSLIHQLRFLGSQQHSQSGVLLTSFLTWRTENSLAMINPGITGRDRGLLQILGSKIGKHLQLCVRAHYRATRKNVDITTQLDKPAECVSGGDLLLLYKILHLLFLHLVRIFCSPHFESQKNYQHDLDKGPSEFQFLRPRESLTNPFRILSLCFGVTGKTSGLISRNNLAKKKLLSASAIVIKS